MIHFHGSTLSSQYSPLITQPQPTSQYHPPADRCQGAGIRARSGDSRGKTKELVTLSGRYMCIHSECGRTEERHCVCSGRPSINWTDNQPSCLPRIIVTAGPSRGARTPSLLRGPRGPTETARGGCVELWRYIG